MEVEMETADAEVLRAREVANSVLASLKSQLTVLRESAAETQQRQWLRLSRELLQTAQKPWAAQATQLKLRHEQLRQQREELEKKLKEGKIGLSSAEEVVDGRPHQASGAAPASAPSTATSATSLRPAVKVQLQWLDGRVRDSTSYVDYPACNHVAAQIE
ncbi:unnamed protein product [Cladocopium goreaui]|uniref:Spindle assembly abnormal protein 6 homolog (HsSAS-6) n=1 Tax=Cladocopium goreaui TaxID=2562237 RepID=A0A9P1CJF7_9DINO|nr:unnamed protein product [Cladocopium goreaui]